MAAMRSLGGAAAAGGLVLWTYHWTGSLQTGASALLAMVVVLAIVGRRSALEAAQCRTVLAEALMSLSRGEQPRRFDPEDLGSLAPLSQPFRALADAIEASDGQVSALSAQLIALPNEVAATIAALRSGADGQEAAVEETSSLLANINTSIRGINDEITNLARSNEETASSIMEMGSAIEQVAASAGALMESVESSTSAVHELNAQIRRVSESGDAVQQVAEDTASAISQMDHTIREVGEHVRGASELTQQVSDSADEGARAVGATIDGIAEIRNLTLDAKTALEGLAERIGAIGEIASVINGISDETNLLSLNAAIIAAQAGEHGKPFAVVAEQVKTLARRTTSSTKEIEALIAAIQEQSENAVKAMAAGIDAVEIGVQRSRSAGEALDRIRDSARDASGRVAEINRAAEEQARNSRHVADSAQRTSEQVQEISSALSEQSQATERILNNATESVEICRQTTRATEEQRASSAYISENIAAITDLIASIQSKTASHERASQGVAESVVSILESARRASEQIPEVARAVVAMRDHAKAIQAEVAPADAENAET
jgi:methyl-accepting chemotaxis protein